MAVIPQRWRVYAHLQNQASKARRADARSWGIEAGLNHLLAADNDETYAAAIGATRRRETYREGIRRRMAEASEVVDPASSLDARLSLDALRRQIRPADWDLLCQVGIGMDYAEISPLHRCSPGALRVRVLRLRGSIACGSAS